MDGPAVAPAAVEAFFEDDADAEAVEGCGRRRRFIAGRGVAVDAPAEAFVVEDEEEAELIAEAS